LVPVLGTQYSGPGTQKPSVEHRVIPDKQSRSDPVGTSSGSFRQRIWWKATMQRSAHPKALPHYERILYATDGSISAREAGRHAVFLAQRAQAQLIVLYVVPNTITRRLSFLLRRVLGEERRTAKRAVDEIVGLATASGVPALAVIERGRRPETIERAAAKFDVDLVVMNSSGSDDLKSIFGCARPGSIPLWAARPVCVIMC